MEKTFYNELDGALTTIDLLPEMLRAMRKARGLTLREVSELSALSVSFLSDLEHGRTRPSLDTLERLATAYQQTITIDIPFRKAQ